MNIYKIRSRFEDYNGDEFTPELRVQTSTQLEAEAKAIQNLTSLCLGEIELLSVEYIGPACQPSPDKSWETEIERWLVGKDKATIGDILLGAIKMDRNKWHRGHQTRIGQIMTRLGWERKRGRDSGGQMQTVYLAPTEENKELKKTQDTLAGSLGTCAISDLTNNNEHLPRVEDLLPPRPSYLARRAQAIIRTRDVLYEQFAGQEWATPENLIEMDATADILSMKFHRASTTTTVQVSREFVREEGP